MDSPSAPSGRPEAGPGHHKGGPLVRRALVTGARGFLGRAVCRTLAEKGWVVIGVIRPGTRIQASAHVTYLEADLSTAGILQILVKDPPDVVIHLAADTPRTYTGPDAAAAAVMNARIDRTVFAASRDFRAGVVYSSGTSVYGLGDRETKTEASPSRPIGPYVAAKLATEELGREILQSDGRHFIVLRISAPYGPGQRAETVIHTFLHRAVQDSPLLYHGSGSRQQDFTYVDDVASAVFKAALCQRSGTYNIASASPVAMRRLAELIVQCLPGCRSRIGPSGQPDPQEGATALFSIQRAMTELGWQPTIPLEDGIRACLRALTDARDENRLSL